MVDPHVLPIVIPTDELSTDYGRQLWPIGSDTGRGKRLPDGGRIKAADVGTLASPIAAGHAIRTYPADAGVYARHASSQIAILLWRGYIGPSAEEDPIPWDLPVTAEWDVYMYTRNVMSGLRLQAIVVVEID